MQVDMHAAKSQLSRLGELAWRGERIVISKAGKPYLDLVPHRGPERRLGVLKGKAMDIPGLRRNAARPHSGLRGPVVQRLLLDAHVLLRAQAEGLIIVTADSRIPLYGVRTIMV